MGLRDSRHNFSNPRWAVTNADVLDPNAVEPPGPQKDTGWQPGVDVPVGEWWNWLHQQAAIFFAYLESWFAKAFTVNHVMRGGKATSAGAVSAGAGLSVNVTLSRVWIDGAMYEVPAATNLALAAADPTDPRFDIVVAELVSGVPAYTVVTGTPAASPAEPTLSADQVPYARVRVNAAAGAPGSIVQRQIYGAQELDELEVDRTFRAGDLGGGDWLLEVDDDVNVGGRIRIAPVAGLVDIGDGLILVSPGSNQVQIDPEAVEFPAPIRRKFDLPRAAFVDRTNVDRQTIGGQEAFVDVGAGSGVIAAVHVPNGGVITAVRLYGYRGTNTPGFTAVLSGYGKGTGVGTTVALLPSNAGSGPTGNFTQELTGLSHTVDQSRCYELGILWVDASGDLGLRAAEVEWEESRPFDGI